VFFLSGVGNQIKKAPVRANQNLRISVNLEAFKPIRKPEIQENSQY
jgi:hypothetical protein